MSNKIAGRAKKFDGLGIDYVSIFDWADGKCISQVVPDAAGNWVLDKFIYATNIGVTYVADGCEPITHGPYEADYISAKYWRVSNIKARIGNDFKGISTLQFLDNNGNNLSNNPTKVFAPHYFGSPSAENRPANAFDGNPNTWTEVNADKFNEDWFIAYEFEGYVSISSIGVAGRNDLPSGLGREWQTADVEVSDDNVNWVKVGTFKPLTAAEDSSLIVKPITFI